ncbi:MAG: alpha-2-macroglobulin family protein, partial [Pseudomonadota bacterium]
MTNHPLMILSRLIFAALLSIISLISTPLALAQPTKPPALIKVTPSGEDSSVTGKIVFQFDRPTVPLGKMSRAEQEIAITISPKVACNWTWLNTSALACVINEDSPLTEATTYQIKIPKRFDLTSPEELSSEQLASFSTTRPRVYGAWNNSWRGPGLPTISVMTNIKVTRESLAASMQLLADGKPYSFSVTEDLPDPRNEPSAEELEHDRNRRWLLTPDSALPINSAVKVWIKPGLQALVGEVKGAQDDNIFSFDTLPDFSFLGIKCRDIKGDEIFITADDKKALSKRCDPLNAVQLAFSSPVSKDQLKNSITSKPDLRGGLTEFDPWEDVRSNSLDGLMHIQGQRYYINLPYGLKADTEYNFTAKAEAVRDLFDRQLRVDISAKLATSHRLPRFVLDNQTSVLEKEGDSKLPLIVNNIDSVGISYQTVTSSGIKTGLSKKLTPYQVKDIAYPFPIDVRAMLGGQSGVVSGTISSTPKTELGSVKFTSQVTPFAVHLKVGQFSSLAWVSSLASGNPVADASVTLGIDIPARPSASIKPLASARTDQRGIAILPGNDTLDPELKLHAEWDDNKPKLIARVEHDGEMALLPLTWDYQVYDDEIFGRSSRRYESIKTWGTTAQGLYKAGDTVQFALWVRNQSDQGLIPPPEAKYSLKVLDPTDKVVHQVDQITLSSFGQFAGEFKTSPDAAVGWYSFELKSSLGDHTWHPLRVLISDFTPSPFKVSATLNTNAARIGQSVSVTTEAKLHAGGPYASAPVNVTATLRPTKIKSEQPALKNFTFEGKDTVELMAHQSKELLSQSGELVTTFTIPETPIRYGQLRIESSVSDDRGKSIATVSSVPFFGADRFIGLDHSEWLLKSGQESRVQAVVIDDKGVAVAGSPIKIDFELLETKAARVRSAGNSFTTRYDTEWTKVSQCELISTTTPVSCAFTPNKPGEYRFIALTKDGSGREHSSILSRWAVGQGETLWSGATNNQLQIVPERDSYKLGDTARIMIHNPFKSANALITIERGGIVRSWTEVLNNSTPVLELPITPELAPGFYLSITLLSPRVEQPASGAVDLGKPTFRMGYTQIKIDEPTKQLTVQAKAESSNYKPRQTVKVELSSQNREGSHPEVEYTVAVIDQAVFDMIRAGRNHYDPYTSFHQLDDLDMRNYNLLKMLIGRQKFETKGANAGGDGGNNIDIRSIKSYISYWNPSIKPDLNGRASISFEAPDNLTRWRIFAIAFTKDAQMGLGEGSFIVSKDTEVRSALPNQVREGDRFDASFTITNRSDKLRNLTVKGTTSGASSEALDPFQLSAEPFKRYPVDLRVTARSSGTALFTVSAADAIDSDTLAASVPVLPRIAPIKSAVSDSATGETGIKIAVPPAIRPEHSSLTVSVSNTLLGGLRGAFSYMRDYPYECWEQRLSKAVVTSYAKRLDRFLPPDFDLGAAEQSVKKTLESASESQAPNGGMSYYIGRDDLADPYLSAYTAQSFNWLKEQGYTPPAEVESKLHKYLQGTLRNDSFARHYTPAMIADVRALAVAALASNRAAALSDALRLKTSFPVMSPFGKAQLILALLELGGDKTITAELVRALIKTGVEETNIFSIANQDPSSTELVLGSNSKSNCAILASLTRAATDTKLSSSQELIRILPKLTRSVMSERVSGDRWGNTQSNSYCVNALERYSSVFEKNAEALKLKVSIDGQEIGEALLNSGETGQIELKYPITANDLGETKE